jgi:hypothetical protein
VQEPLQLPSLLTLFKQVEALDNDIDREDIALDTPSESLGSGTSSFNIPSSSDPMANYMTELEHKLGIVQGQMLGHDERIVALTSAMDDHKRLLAWLINTVQALHLCHPLALGAMTLEHDPTTEALCKQLVGLVGKVTNLKAAVYNPMGELVVLRTSLQDMEVKLTHGGMDFEEWNWAAPWEF